MNLIDDVIYLDNQATTRCDPQVAAAMLTCLTDDYGNAHSLSHHFGRNAAAIYAQSMSSIAESIGCEASEIITTSGATEANNLAIQGFCTHPRQKRRHIVTVTTEHPSVLDPIAELEKSGFRVTRVPVLDHCQLQAGRLDLELLRSAISDETALVSVMLANNEIGVIQDLAAVADVAHMQGCMVHTDATQAVGKLPIDVARLDVDLLSASAHKFHGPKGIGFLYVRQRQRRIRLRPLMLGGGQQAGLRSGTLNVPAVKGMSLALQLCSVDLSAEAARQARLVVWLYDQLRASIPELVINGSPLDSELRLPGNLNICFPDIEGDSLMSAIPELAISSGAACSSMEPGPSHVLLALALPESAARRSLRIGLSRFTTEEEIARAANLLAVAYWRLKREFA